MSNPLAFIEEVRQVLLRFQGYYTLRDPGQLEPFLEMLADDDLEVIGTNGLRPAEGEWYLGKASARQIFLADWQNWGDLRLDVPATRIRVNGDTAWLSANGTVSMTILAGQNYADYLAFVRRYLDEDGASAEEKLLYILRGGSNTLYELRRGEKFCWLLRFTAVLVHQESVWKFQQMQFSFPTLYFPDARIFG